MRIDQDYRPMTLADLAAHLRGARDDETRWRLTAEFLEEYRHESADERLRLLSAEPAGSGDQRWDVLLAALAEHLCAHQEYSAPAWSEPRHLRRFWFPFNTPAARVDAVVHAPAAAVSSSPPRNWKSRERHRTVPRPRRHRRRVPQAR